MISSSVGSNKYKQFASSLGLTVSFFYRFRKGRARVGRRGRWFSVKRKVLIYFAKRWRYLSGTGRILKVRYMKKYRQVILGRILRIRLKRQWFTIRKRYKKLRRNRARRRRRRRRRASRRRRRRRRRRRNRRRTRRRRRRRRRTRRRRCVIRFRYGRHWRRVIRRKGKLIFRYKKSFRRFR